MFPMGFWNYVPIEKVDASSVKDWVDAGMTLPMGPAYDGRPEHLSAMRAILDAAADAGLRVILCQKELTGYQLMKCGEDAYRTALRVAIEALGDHPATFGFSVGDEPGSEHFEAFCRATCIQRELAPHLTPFSNLLPMHEGSERRMGFLDWGAYLDRFAQQSSCPLLCYDCYSQMLPEGDGEEDGMDLYFRNLNTYRAAAERAGIPFWTTLLSAGHFKYRCPNEDDFRWQLNTAVAHGAKGILWFFLYMREPHVNYRVPPIDEHYERTGTFAWLSRVNRTFLKTYGDLFARLALQRVRHVGRCWGGTSALDGAGLVVRAEGGDLIVSELKDPDGRDYVAVVNNGRRETVEAKIWVRGTQPKLHHIRWEGVELPLTPHTGAVDWARFCHWLAPGQMEVVRVSQST